MTTTYPATLDTFVNPVATDALNSGTVPHTNQHDNLNDAVLAIETALGTNPQGSYATVVTRLNALGAGATNYVLTSPIEITNIVAAAPTATQAIYSDTSLDWFFTTNTANNFILNLAAAAGTTLNARLSVGQTKTFAIRVINSTTAYYMTALQIDGSAVTPKWAGGTVPTSGDASSRDIYIFVVTKTAASTYEVLASLQKAA